MKGFFKGFKNMFAGKEHEIEIGFPTDVKHVSHIGWNSSSDHAPSWMKEFQTAAGYTSASLSNMGNLENNWLNRGILTEPESNRSLSEPFNSVNKSASTREDGRPCRKTRRKKKPRNPGSPSSSTSSSSTSRNKTHVKSKSTNFRSSCAAAMEDACAGPTNPYRTGCAREIT